MSKMFTEFAIAIKGQLTEQEIATLCTLVQYAARLANPDVEVKVIGVDGLILRKGR